MHVRYNQAELRGHWIRNADNKVGIWIKHGPGANYGDYFTKIDTPYEFDYFVNQRDKWTSHDLVEALSIADPKIILNSLRASVCPACQGAKSGGDHQLVLTYPTTTNTMALHNLEVFYTPLSAQERRELDAILNSDDSVLLGKYTKYNPHLYIDLKVDKKPQTDYPIFI